MHSVDTVLPEYQHPQVGDGFGYGANKMSFALVEPEHVLATRSADGNWVWTFVLEECDRKTRLISRNRFRLPRLKDKLRMIPMEPASLVMERKMLCGSSSAPSGWLRIVEGAQRALQTRLSTAASGAGTASRSSASTSRRA
jgi:hypothetical protein